MLKNNARGGHVSLVLGPDRVCSHRNFGWKEWCAWYEDRRKKHCVVIGMGIPRWHLIVVSGLRAEISKP